MPDVVQVHAFLPRPLKRRAFGVFAQREMKFSHWLRDALEGWLRQVERQDEEPQNEWVAGSQEGR
jgi:hypothetical protein